MSVNNPSNIDPMRVLLVEDNEDAAELLAQLLARDGDLAVETTSSGAEALQRAEAGAPHVVVVDLGLPDMDGCDLMSRLKALPGLHGSVFIALTGRSGQAELERSKAAGFRHHFVKPPDLQALRSAVRGSRRGVR